MKTIVQILAAALLAAPAVSLAQTTESAKAGAGAVETSLEVSGPKTPEKPGLDVSRMPFDPESIRQVVKFHMAEIQGCYEKVQIGRASCRERV